MREGDYRVSTFLCSLRPGPAPLDVFGALRGTGPSLAGNVGTGRAFALVREGDYRVSTFLRSLRPGPAPLDVFGGALRGIGPALAGNVGTGGAFALSRGGNYRVSTFLCSLRPGPAPLDVFGALRGTGPALAGNVGTGGAFALSRGGNLGCRRSYARSDPVPLRLTYLVGRSAGPGLPWGASRWMPCFVLTRLPWASIGSSGSLRSPGRRGGFREASSGLQLANQGVAGGEDAFVGGDGFRHRAELGC